MIFLLILKKREETSIKKEAKELISLFEPPFESILYSSYFIDELYYENLDNIAEILKKDLKKDSILKIALFNNFFEITILDKNKKVLISTSRKKGEILSDKLIKKGKNEEIEGDSLFYLREKKDYNVFLIKDVSDLKNKKREAGLKKMLEKIGKEERIEYLTLESNGEAVFSTKKIKLLEDEKIRERVFSRNEVIIRKNRISDKEVLEVLKSFSFKGKPVGILRLGLSLNRFKGRMQILNTLFFISLCFVIFVAILIILNIRSAKKELVGSLITGSGYSLYKIKGKSLVNISGVKLKLNFSHIGDKNRFLIKENGDFYFGIREKDILFFLKINEVIESIKEKEKRREEEGILRVLSGFAHEIKNPLNTLKLYLYKIKNKIGEEYFEIEKAFDTLSGSIEEFINLLRPFYIKKEKVKVKEFITEIVEKMSNLLRQNDIEVSIEGEEREVYFDKMQMEKVFTNLIKNGIEAQPEGGKIEIKLYEKDNKFIISIKDYGIGIKRENMERIFEPYFTTKKAGTGLGLFTVKRIIESHGFEIKVLSEEGKGAEFLIII